MNGAEVIGKVVPTTVGSLAGTLIGFSYWSDHVERCNTYDFTLCVETPFFTFYEREAFIVVCSILGLIIGALFAWIITRLDL